MAHGTPAHPDELAAHDGLGSVDWSGLPSPEWRFSRHDASRPVKIRSRFQVDNGPVPRAAALQGDGIVQQPEAVAADDLQSGGPVQVLGDCEAPSRPLSPLFPTRDLQPPKLRASIDRVVQVVGRPRAVAP